MLKRVIKKSPLEEGVLADKRLRVFDVAVYFVLKEVAKDGQVTDVSHIELSQAIHTSTQTVKGALNNLIDCGYITAEKKMGRGIKYTYTIL